MSTTIDQKVVEMRFDNSRFEQNVRQSMNTIDRLKEKLDFSKSTKSIEELDSKMNKFNTSGMVDSLDRVKVSFSALQVAGATVIQDLTRSALRFSKKFTSISRNVIGQIKSGGKQRAFNIEQAKFQLKGLGIEWSKIEDDINYGVKDTAYGLDAAAKAASQLSASNVKIGDEMKAALRGISGVAAMTNASFEEISPIFTTIAGQGKLMTMQLRQLESRGLNAAATLGKALGKTEAQIREMVTKGEIDFNTFSKAMNEAFGEHAKEANKTFTGALSNVKAALSRIGASFYTPGMENFRKIFVNLIPTINGLHTAIKPLIEDVNNFVGRTSKKLIKTIKSLNGEIDKTTRKVHKDQWDILKENGVVNKTFVKALKNSARDHGVNIDKMIKKSGSMRATLKKDWLSYDILSDALKNYKKNRKLSEDDKFTKKQVKALKRLRKAAKETGTPLNQLMEELNRPTALSVFIDSINNLKVVLTQLKGAAKSAWDEIFPEKKEISIYNIANAVKEFTHNLTLNQEKFDKVKRTFKGIFAVLDTIGYVIKNVVVTALDVLGYAIDSSDTSILDITANLGDFLVKIRDSVKNSKTFKNVLTGISNILKKGIDIIKSITTTVKKILSNKSLQKTLTTIKDIISSISTIARNLFKDATDGLSKISPKASDILSKIGQFIKELRLNPGKVFTKGLDIINIGLTKISDALKSIKGDDFKTIVKKITDFIVEKSKSAYEYIQKFSKDSKETIANTLNDIKNKIVEFVNSTNKLNFLDNLFKNSNNGLLQKLPDAVKNMSSTVKNVLKNLYKYVKTIVGKIFDIFGQNESGRNALVTIVFMFELIKLFEEFKTLISKLISPFASLDAVFGTLKDTLKDYQNSLKADRIVSIAKAVFILASAMFIVASIPQDKLLTSVGVIGGTLAAVLLVTALISKVPIDSVYKTSIALKSLAFSVLEIIFALKMLETINVKDLSDKKLKLVSEIVVGLIVISVAASRLTGYHQTLVSAVGTAATMLSFAISLRLIINALRKINDLDLDYRKTGFNLLLIISTLTALAGILSSTAVKATTVGSALTLVAMSVSLRILFSILKAINKASFDTSAKQMKKLTVALLGLITLTTILNSAGPSAGKVGLGALGLVLAVRLLGSTVKYLSSIETDVTKGIIIAGLLTVFISVLLKATGMANIDKHTSTGLVSLIVAVSILGAVVVALGSIRTDIIAKGTTAITAIGIMLSALIKSTGKASKVGRTVGNMFIIIGAISVLAVLVNTLGKLDGVTLAKGEIAAFGILVIIKILLTLITNANKTLGGEKSIDTFKRTISNLFKIIGMVVALAAVIIGLSYAGDLTGGILALYSVIGAIKVLEMVIVSVKKTLGDGRSVDTLKRTISNLYKIIGIIAALTLITITLSTLDLAGIIRGTAAVYALTGLVFLLTQLSKVSTGAVSSLPVLYGLVGVIAIISLIAIAITKIGGSETIGAIASLSVIILALSACMVLLGTIGTSVAAPALIGLAGLTVFLAGLTLVLSIFGILAKNYEKAAMAGIDFLKKIFYGLGELIGSIVAGFSDTVIESIKRFGEGFNEFASSMVEAFGKFDSVDENSIKSVNSILDILAKVTALSFIDALSGFISAFTGPTSFDSIKEKLVAFAGCITAYNDALPANTDWTATKESSTALDKLIDVINKLPKEGGLWSNIFGKTTDVEEFGTKLVTFANGLVGYNDIVTGVDWSGVTDSIAPAQALSDLQKSLPKSGGVFQNFFGDANLETFGNQLIEFGKGILGYYNKVKGIKDWDAVKKSAEKSEALATIANEIPKADGSIQKFIGVKNLGAFGDQLEKYGTAFSKYAEVVSNVSFGNVEKSIDLTNKFVELVQIVKSDKLYKDDKLYGFMIYITEYILPEFEKMTGFGNINFAKSNSLLNSVLSSVKDFVTNMDGLDISQADNATNIVSKLVDSLSSIKTMDISISTKFNTILNDISSSGLKVFLNVFKNSDEDVKTAFEEFYNDIKSNLDELTNKLEKDFKNSGKQINSGLLSGIKSSKSKVNKSLNNLGADGLESFNDSVGIHSPATEFIKAAKYICAGIINGIKASTSKVKDSIGNLGTDMTEEFTKNLKLEVNTDDIVGTLEKSLSSNKLSNVVMASAIPTNISGLSEKVSKIAVKISKDLQNTTAKEYIKSIISFNEKSISAILKSAGKNISKKAISGAKTLMEASNQFVVGLYTNTDQYKTDAKNLKDHQKELKNSIKKFNSAFNQSKADEKVQKSIDSKEAEIEKLKERYSEESDKEAKKALKKSINKHNKEVKELKKKLKGGTSSSDLTSLQNNIKQATQNIVNDRKTIIKNIKKTVDDMKDTIETNVKDFINPFKIALEEVESGITDIFSKFEKSTSTSYKKLYKNLMSQINAKNLFEDYINKLTQMGYDSDVINKIKEMGVAEGSAIAKALAKATTAEVEAYNQAYAKTKTNTTKEKWLTDIQNRKNQLKEYDTLMLKASSMGFGRAVMQEIGAMDIESAISYLKIMTNMHSNEIDILKSSYEEMDSIAKKQANMVVGTYVHAGSEAMKKLSDTLSQEKAEEIGENVCKGLTTGIINNQGKITKAGKKLGKDLLAAIKEVLGIHSPSREFRKVGYFSIRGLANGIINNSSLVTGAISNLSNDAISMMNRTISAIGESIDGDMTPTIRPVLDLSDVERKASNINGLFNSRYAMGLTASVNRDVSGLLNTGGVNNTTNNKNVTFVQNNYSPEPLSRIDIYKQTDRQLKFAEVRI